MLNKKVLVGMSGGIDSTMSALFLKEQGYEVEGVYMKLHTKPMYHEVNIARAQKAADFVGMKLHVVDLQAVFDEKVFYPFIKTYQDGHTPNPCALCNRELKFGEMVKLADKMGFDYIATGHYLKSDGNFLYAADDDTKDQSYFLFYVKQEVLKRVIFPLGDMKKARVKELAASINGLESFASQGESSEICFVETTYMDLLKNYVDVDNEGEVVDSTGKVVGKHKGYMHYTIGKRRGFSVNGAHEPHFVTEIQPQTNRIVVGKREALACSMVVLGDLNMFTTELEFCSTIKLRYRTKAVPCSVKIANGEAIVLLHEKVFGVAVGQAGVLYDGDRIIGGGWISSQTSHL